MTVGGKFKNSNHFSIILVFLKSLCHGDPRLSRYSLQTTSLEVQHVFSGTRSTIYIYPPPPRS